MRFTKTQIDDIPLLIEEHERRTSPITSRSSSSRREAAHSALQCHTLRQEQMPCSIDKRTPSAEYIYTEIVKNLGNNEFIEEKRLLKRASWSPAIRQEHGLPPTGKRTDHESTTQRNSNRVRLRPKVARYFNPQPTHDHSNPSGRPASFNERYDRHLIERKLSNPSSLNRTSSFSHQRYDPCRSPSTSSIDTIIQITKRTSPSIDSSDFISDTSAASSVTTTNTVTSLGSTIIPSQISRRISPSFERCYSSTKRPFLSEYQQQQQQRRYSNHIDYKFLSPVSQTNNVPLTSPISSRSTSTSTCVTCPKGHEQSLSSPINSSLNQYREFTSQTFNADTSRDDIASPTTTTTATTTSSLMTMSMSPNRHHNQTRSAKAIITSAQISPTTNVTITTNNTDDGLKQQQQEDQTESIIVPNNGCLKSPTNTNRNNRIKKSVHFHWHSPEETRSTSPVKKNSTSNYRPTVTIASSSSSSTTTSNGHSNSDNDEGEKEMYDDQDNVETLRREEKKRIETTTRTFSPSPLTTTMANTILRSFSLSPSPSPLSKEEKNDSRRHRQDEEEQEQEEGEKKENVDEANCTTSRRVTTAATHLHCTTTTATVTFNDGSNNVSQKNESNSTNNSNRNLLKRPSSTAVDQSMPLNSLLVKTSSLNPITNPPSSPSTTTTTSSAKKLISNGFFSLIGRSNSNNNKSSTSTEENKQLRRTSSTQLRAQRKAKQQTTSTAGTNGNQRLSADVESLFPVSSINNNHGKLSNDDIQTFDKATTDQNIERTSSISIVTPMIDKNSNTTNINSSLVSCTKTNMNIISTPMSMNSPIANTTTTTTTIFQADEGDSLNNGLLFQPVTDRKCDYVLHNHETTKKEPFFLSPPKSLSNGDESSMMMQTSTLIISTPPQYHYYLYPPINNPNTLSSSSPTSSSTSSSSISSAKKPTKILVNPNRTVSNVSINSVSTNSSSSCPSFESQPPDTEYQQSSQTPLNPDDETFSCSTYSITTTNNNNNHNTKNRQKKVVQSALIDWKMKSFTGTTSNVLIKPKPVILSDSVQAFWPPPPSPATLDKDLGLTTVTLTTEQTKQSDLTPVSNSMLSSMSNNNNNNNESIHVNHTDVLPTKDEIGSYSEEHLFTNGCLRNASNTSLEDTQASYTERLREKSRSIPMNGTTDMHSYLTRSFSKDALNNNHHHSRTSINQLESNENLDRPQSAGQQMRAKSSIMMNNNNNNSHPQSEIDFQSKREFFENRIYTDNNTSSNTSLSSLQTNHVLPSKPKLYTLSPTTSQINHYPQQITINNNPARNITRRSWNDLSSRQGPPSSFPRPSLEQTSIQKPIRIVKAVQRSPPINNESSPSTRPISTSKTYLLAKPGLFTASPINSSQKLPNKPFTSTRRFQSRDENDLQIQLKDFAQRYPHHRLLNALTQTIISPEHHLSSDYIRALFPIPDRLRRIRSRESSGGDTNSYTTSSNSSSDYTHRTVSNDSCIFDDDTLRQVDDLLINLKKRFEHFKDNQRTINAEIDDNRILGVKLLNILESNAQSNEIDKFKLHINEIDTITSILLKLSSRLAKIENDLLSLNPTDEQNKANLFERREKVQQKHDEAKSLKDGIDRRSRLVNSILRKYLSNEQYDDYEHFIRMKSTLLMDEKDLEENLHILEKQIEIFNQLANSNENSLKHFSNMS